MSKEAKFTTEIKFYNSPEDGYCHLGLVDKDRKFFYDVLDNEVYDVKDDCYIEVGEEKNRVPFTAVSYLGSEYFREMNEDLGSKKYFVQRKVSKFAKNFIGFGEPKGVTLDEIANVNKDIVRLQIAYDSKKVETEFSLENEKSR